jgi:hypothetical protein
MNGSATERTLSPSPPFRYNKLLFCLCRSCVLEQNVKSECRHFSDAERYLDNTWIIHEVRLEVYKVYKILEIQELYQYEITRYNPDTGEGHLFVEYINTFSKVKAEASGYPCWVRTPDDNKLYIEQFHQSEGIRVNRDPIRYNAAKRALAKLSQFYVGKTYREK